MYAYTDAISEEVVNVRDELICKIKALIDKCHDLPLLDLILQILQKFE